MMNNENEVASKTVSEACTKKIDFFKYSYVAICLVISAILAIMGKDGWGWFLFAAVMLA